MEQVDYNKAILMTPNEFKKAFGLLASNMSFNASGVNDTRQAILIQFPKRGVHWMAQYDVLNTQGVTGGSLLVTRHSRKNGESVNETVLGLRVMMLPNQGNAQLFSIGIDSLALFNDKLIDMSSYTESDETAERDDKKALLNKTMLMAQGLMKSTGGMASLDGADRIRVQRMLNNGELGSALVTKDKRDVMFQQAQRVAHFVNNAQVVLGKKPEEMKRVSTEATVLIDMLCGDMAVIEATALQTVRPEKKSNAVFNLGQSPGPALPREDISIADLGTPPRPTTTSPTSTVVSLDAFRRKN